MKKIIRLVAIITFAISSTSLMAQTKMGHIKTQELIQVMPEYVTAQTKMNTEQEAVEKELASLGEQFQAKFAEYNQNASTYTDVIRATKEQELQDLQQRVQRFQEVATQNLEKTRQTLMQPIIDKATDAINAVGKENGFTYIFDMSTGVVLYTGTGSIDIMPLVKKKLNITQ